MAVTVAKRKVLRLEYVNDELMQNISVFAMASKVVLRIVKLHWYLMYY